MIDKLLRLAFRAAAAIHRWFAGRLHRFRIDIGNPLDLRDVLIVGILQRFLSSS